MKLSDALTLARPSAAFNSSTQPYASTRGSALDTRRPYISEVSPASPVLVAMDIRELTTRTSATNQLPSIRRFCISTSRLSNRGLCFWFLDQGRAHLLAQFD